MTVLEAAVIADDLGGAADCGLAFAAAGLEAFVSIGGAPPRGAQVVAFDIDSRRRIDDAEAAALARAAALRAHAEGARVLYRKLDPTLRGHVGAELAATLAAAEEVGRRGAVVLLAPASPATGRTTRGGRVLVKGVPLDETDLWRDARQRGPAEPAAMLRAAGVRAEVLPLPTVRGSAGGVAAELERFAAAGAGAVVCDAEGEQDLRTIAEAGALLGRPVIWAGAAALAHHLPAALRLKRSPARKGPRTLPAGSVLVVVGSRSPVAREQARALAAEPGIVRVDLDPAALLDGRARPAAEALARALDAGADVLAALGDAPVSGDRGPQLAAAAARLVAPLASRLTGVVATGGDVARAMLGALRAGGLFLEGELEPGVPAGIADSRPPVAVVTKAGAFGSAQTLVRCRAALRARAPRGDVAG